MPAPFRLLAPRPRTIRRDTFEVALEDGRTVTVQRVRDPRARRIKLSVDERGARLSLPARSSAAAGERFVASQLQWLADQLDRHAASVAPLAPGVTASLPLRGAQVAVCWQRARTCRVELDPGDGDPFLRFALPATAAPAAVARALKEFYLAQARADVGRWLPRHLPSLPQPPRQFRFRVMSSQWGSLAPDGSVSLDLSLVLARPSAFEYVLVHELCHLLQRNHSAAFWAEVQARCPGWRDERDWLAAEGRRLKSMLRVLLEPAPG